MMKLRACYAGKTKALNKINRIISTREFMALNWQQDAV